MKSWKLSLVLGLVLCGASALSAQVVNVYSARHYDTDDQIYQKFEETTGIKVRLIEGNSDALLARLKREGKRSPADLFITVDSARLYRTTGRLPNHQVGDSGQTNPRPSAPSPGTLVRAHETGPYSTGLERPGETGSDYELRRPRQAGPQRACLDPQFLECLQPIAGRIDYSRPWCKSR